VHFFNLRRFKYFLDFDLFISDFVPEVFLLAKKMNIRSIGVCHFTWSWFAKNISKKKESFYKKIQDCEKLAEKISYLTTYLFKDYSETQKNEFREQIDYLKNKNEELSEIVNNFNSLLENMPLVESL
jgi:hypothetical protein